jgi:prepilin-type N-terminal cleavage/methylation domain-containing protein
MTKPPQPSTLVPRPCPLRPAFTLIELLIVIGLLGMVVMVMLASFNSNRQETLDHSIVQKELSDIQRAFQRMNADCVLRDDDLGEIARYGLRVLITEGIVPGWDSDKGRGWRGPYIEREGQRAINPNSVGQLEGTEFVPVVETPYVATDSDPQYYRVVATALGNVGGEDVEQVILPTGTIYQLWVISPNNGGVPGAGDQIENFPKEFRRRLLLDRD